MISFSHKVVIPQRSRSLVSRPRLRELLQPIPTKRLLTIAAPAGYGKTSLLIDFAAAPPLPVAWYTLDASDRDPWQFLRYLIAAIEQVFPGQLGNAATQLARENASFTQAANALIQDIDQINASFILVIDDWHLVDGVADCRELIGQILQQTRNCHVLLASRIHPGLPDLMLLAARQQMLGIDETVLRFSSEEALAVLAASNYPLPSPEHMHALVERANGWITSILLTLQSGVAAPSFAAGARAERQVYAFLAEQVFDQQPETMQQFLLDASLLSELTIEQCNRLFKRYDAEILLDSLVQQHMFVVEIKPGVLRFHPLFSEFLQGQYRRRNLEGYRQRIGEITNDYIRQKQWSLAFDNALRADNTELAHAVAAQGGDELYLQGHIETLEQWFAVLPQDDLSATLLCLKGRILLDRSKHLEAQLLADLADARADEQEKVRVQLLQGQIAWVSGDYASAIQRVQPLLESATISKSDLAAALRVDGICNFRLGQTEVAVKRLQQALTIERGRGDVGRMAHLQHDLAICYVALSRLREAENLYSQAYSCWQNLGNFSQQALCLNSKAMVQYMAGSYAAAHRTLLDGLASAKQGASDHYQALIQTSLGDLYSDLALAEPARTAYASAQEHGGSAFLRAYVELAHIRLLVREGQFFHALQELDQIDTSKVPPADLLLLRAQAHHGIGNAEQAREELGKLLQNVGTSISSDHAKALLLQAQFAATSPANPQLLVASLEQAVAITDQLGRDSFLVAETLHMPGFLRRAQTASWARASDWMQRQKELRSTARQLLNTADLPKLTVHTLGTDSILLNDQNVGIGWVKAREVFYYLLAHPNGASSETLREAIWPNLAAEGSRGALKSAIFELRAALPRDSIMLHHRQIYQFNREAVQLQYDAEQLLEIVDQRSQSSDMLFEAIEWYKGMYLPWSDNTWSSTLRSQLEQRYLGALRRGAECCVEREAFLDALAFFRAILDVDSLDEAAHAGVMRCLITLGNRAAAIKQYRSLQRLLDDELGLELESSSEVAVLYQRILKTA